MLKYHYLRKCRADVRESRCGPVPEYVRASDDVNSSLKILDVPDKVRSFGSCFMWSLDSLMKAGVNPSMMSVRSVPPSRAVGLESFVNSSIRSIPNIKVDNNDVSSSESSIS